MINSLLTYLAGISITFCISVGIVQLSVEIGKTVKASISAKFGKNLGVSNKKEVCLKGCNSEEQEKLKDVLATKFAIDNLSVEHSIDELGNTKTTAAVKTPIYKKGLLTVDVGLKTKIHENKVKDSNTAYLLNNLADRSRNKAIESFLKRPYIPKTSNNKTLPLTLNPKLTFAEINQSLSINKIKNSVKLPVGSRILTNKDFQKIDPIILGR